MVSIFLVFVVMIGMMYDLELVIKILKKVVGFGYFMVIDLVDWFVWVFGMLFCDVYYVIGVIVVIVVDKGVELYWVLFEEM